MELNSIPLYVYSYSFFFVFFLWDSVEKTAIDQKKIMSSSVIPPPKKIHNQKKNKNDPGYKDSLQ